MMSRSQVGAVKSVSGRTYAAEATPFIFFLIRTCVAFFTGNGFDGCEPESVEIQAVKEMLPSSPRKIGDMARWISSIWRAVVRY